MFHVHFRLSGALSPSAAESLRAVFSREGLAGWIRAASAKEADGLSSLGTCHVPVRLWKCPNLTNLDKPFQFRPAIICQALILPSTAQGIESWS